VGGERLEFLPGGRLDLDGVASHLAVRVEQGPP
jgi:hypothetical protein